MRQRSVQQTVAAAEPQVQGLRRRPDEVTWSYSGTLNQKLWGQRYPTCNSARQSPVDVDETFTQVRLQYQNLQLEGWERHIAESSVVRNNGTTVVIDVGGEFFVSGGGLSGRFRVGRLSFHWGHCNSTSEGSEHSLNGMKYPLEMQMYCFDGDRFQSLDEAIASEGRIAALAVLFETSLDENGNMTAVVDAVNTVTRFGKTEPIDTFPLRSLLPLNTEKYYIYNGSLTAPPCSETVEWIIFKHTVPISETQLESFCEVLTLEQSGYVILTDYLQNNFRVQQQQFTGQVFASYTGVEEVLTPTCSSEPQNVQADAQNDTTLVVTWERPKAVYDTSIDWYLVTYQRLQGPPQSRQEYRTDGDQDVGAIISSLSSNSSYVVQVVSVCINGLRGRWSDQVIVDMPREDPEADSDSELVTLETVLNKEVFSNPNWEKEKTQPQLNVSPEDHSPVEEVPLEQTKVYQNLPRPGPDTGTKFRLNQNVKKSQEPSKTRDQGLNSIEEPERVPLGFGPGLDPGFGGNGAIWIQEPTEQPGFLFPVARTIAESPSNRRKITEEASLAVSQTYDMDATDTFTPLSEDSLVTDVFYEDTLPVSKPENTTAPVTNTPDSAGSEWIPDRDTTVSHSLVHSVYKPFTSSSLLRVLMHTTQSMFTESSNSSHESRVGLVAVDSEKRTVVPLAVVSTLTILCLLVLLGILIYWRNCFQTADFYPDDTASPKVVSAPSTPLLLATDGHEPLTVKQFVKHVLELHASNAFSKEFEEVQACTLEMGITSDSSNHPDNKSKNRYINILAYDHSRVKLSNGLDEEGCRDYINANFVDGYERSRAYIAAQGPLRASREDFWRMIWQQNIGVIIMITNLKEKGRTKCDQYWPEATEEDYGPFQVSLKSTKTLAYYTLRTLSVRDTVKSCQRKEEHTVLHYHYTQWPDMGVPEYTLPVLSFIRTSSQSRTQDMGPVLVHCSAGVGRTGTYIVIDSMLQQIQDQASVNVLGFLKHVRTQRNFLVQTEEQYVFIHDALVEAILSRETSVSSDLLHSYVSELLTPGLSGRTRMDKQLKLISQRQAKHADYSTALKEGNAERNRAKALMPVERSRVCLTASETNSTGYINASYVMGHHHCREFIVSQTPLSSTVEDFWRMILENNIHTVVSLTEPHSQHEGDAVVYCPSRNQPISFKDFTVSFSSEEHVCLSGSDKLLVQDFKLHCLQSNYELEVRQYCTSCWPNPDSPIRNSFDLINLVTEHNGPTEGPTLVHDRMGGPVSGLFCALTTLYSELQEEGAVDVYLVARMTNLMRPGVFNDMKVYKEQAVQQRQHQEAVKALRRLTATEETAEELRPEETVEELLIPQEKSEELIPEEKSEELIPEETSEELIPEETIVGLIPEETVEEQLIPQEKSEELIPEEKSEELIPEETSEELIPEETSEEFVPEETVEELRPEEKSEELTPEETIVGLIPEETVEELLIPEETVEELLIPEETVEALTPEDSQLEDLPSEIQEAAITKQASAEETVDISPEETNETQSIGKGTRSAHLMAAAMIKKLIQKAHMVPDTEQQIRLVQMLSKVETGVRIPEDSQLTDKDLKAIGKAAAKSLLQECGSVSVLSDNSFTEETMKLNLNLQLMYHLAHRPQTKPTCFFARVWKVFRRNRISSGPLRTYLSSPNY
uniref:protein-tyrosine-phosphatase n=1 Tax=Knipowitschia caucasica TaxID=637954 RepID=A0AAV2IXE3_KNICA